MKDLEKNNDQEMKKVVGGISQDDALNIALQHAGLTRGQLRYCRNERDIDHGRKVYEISFSHNGFEYEYDIDASNGNILKCEKDWD